jgi:hypothetical protein
MILKLQYLFISLYIRFKGRPGALKKAIKRADRLCRKKRKRYRVFFIENKYQALSRQQIQMKKHSGEWNPNVNVTKMEPVCFYDTLGGLQKSGEELINNFKR